MVRIVIITTLLLAVLATVSSAALPPFNTNRLYSEAGFAAATKPYTDAIAKNADDADAHYWLGVAYLHAARLFRFGVAPYAAQFPSKAVASLERAVKLRPTSFPALLALLEAYAMVGDRERYDATFDRMLQIAPPRPPK